MADYQYLTDTGVIIADTGEIRQTIETEYKSVFGTDLSVSPSTPQGILINVETIARSEMVRNNAALANQLNPNIAGGVFLDAIGALMDVERNPAVNTTASCILTGVAGTIIVEGSAIKDSINGNIFKSASTVTLTGSPATATVNFIAAEEGPISAAAGTLTEIIDGVLGWETVTNPLDGTLGTYTQSDISFRTLRKLTLANQGSSLPEAIISAVYLVPNVTSLSFRENYTDASIVIDTITLLPHSIYLCVDGGTDTAVATAILSKKSGGCNYNGDLTIPVYEPFSEVTYPVKFSRPTEVPILARVYYKQAGSTGDPIADIKAAILAYAAGEIDGEVGFVVNGAVSSFELAGAINNKVPGLYVKLVEITKASLINYSTAEIPIRIFEKATILAASITVIPA